MRRTAHTLFLAALALLPWAWFPPFPWIHEHAQWSDVCVAAAFVAWLASPGRRDSLRRCWPVWAALLVYVLAAAASWAAHPSGVGAAKLVGIASLAATMILSSDIAGDPRRRRQAFTVIALSSVGVCVVAWAGVALAAVGHATPLVGAYGDLLPGAYVRAQATLRHPNLLASYLIFAWTVVAAGDRGRWRALALGAIAVTMPLTLSRGLLALACAFLWGRARTRAARQVALLCTALVVLVLVALTVVHVEVDPTRFWEARLLETPSIRREALVTALATALAYPWAGCGPSCSPALVHGFPYDAHCTPVNIAATLGLPALAALAVLLGLLWRHRPRPTAQFLWAGLAALLLDGLAQDVEDFRHVWVLLGLLASVRPQTAAPDSIDGA